MNALIKRRACSPCCSFATRAEDCHCPQSTRLLASHHRFRGRSARALRGLAESSRRDNSLSISNGTKLHCVEPPGAAGTEYSRSDPTSTAPHSDLPSRPLCPGPHTPAGPGRRTVLLRSLGLPALASLTLGSDDPTTLLNSVLAGYGLPKLPGATGFKLLDDFDQGFSLEYPRGWVVRPNTLRRGVYISDFNTADKLSVEVLPLPPPHEGAGEEGDGEELVMAAVRAAVLPGAAAGQQDDRLLLPPASRVRSRTARVEGREYTYLEFPSETVTRSGYQIRRRNLAVVTAKRDTLVTLNASSRSDQFNPDKEALLRHVVESFRARG